MRDWSNARPEATYREGLVEYLGPNFPARLTDFVADLEGSVAELRGMDTSTETAVIKVHLWSSSGKPTITKVAP